MHIVVLWVRIWSEIAKKQQHAMYDNLVTMHFPVSGPQNCQSNTYYDGIQQKVSVETVMYRLFVYLGISK